MIKGTLEIYKNLDNGEELVYQDDNLIVDGAGKTLVDILTTNPDVSGIKGASAILDASNYAIQAISFGKAAEAYNKNAHIFSSTTGHFNHLKHGSHGLAVIVVSPSASRDPYNFGGPHQSPYLDYYSSGVDETLGGNGDLIPSSYVPPPHLPKAPSPLDIKLEEGVILSGCSGTTCASSFGTDIGQNLNFLAYADHLISKVSGADVAANVSACIGSTIGCFAPAVSGGTDNRAGVTFYFLSSYGQFGDDASGTISPKDNTTPSGTYGSLFNHVSSMDTSGFVRAYYPSGYGYHPDASSYSEAEESSPLSGLIISSLPNFSSTGEVYCTMTISGHDLAMANLYGGITTMGLWVPDIPKCLEAGNVPPLKFNPIDNDFRYRLFAKKVLLQNICAISDNMTMWGKTNSVVPGCTNYSNLTLVWKLRFL